MNDITPVEILMLDYVGGGIRQDMKFPGYWQYQYGVDAQEVIAGLLEKNFLQIADTGVSLQHMEVKELKEILSKMGMKVSGKKADLVERIVKETDAQSLLLLDLPTYYVRTDAGNNILDAYTRPDMKKYLEAVMIYGDKERAFNSISAIRQKNYGNAEKYIMHLEKYDIDVFNGFTDFHIKGLGAYSEYEAEIKACIIYSFMAGNSRSDLAKYLMIELYRIEVPDEIFTKVNKYLLGMKSFFEIKGLGETLPKVKYVIHTMKDERVCKVCKKREGKTFLASKAELGVNFPPFDDCTCECCRCYASVSL